MTGTWAAGWATGDIVTAAEFKKGAGSISDTILGGIAATIDITGIVATYAHLLVVIYARTDAVGTVFASSLRFNNDATANYDYQSMTASAAAVTAAETFGAGGIQHATIPGSTAGANVFSCSQTFIPYYAGTTNNKIVSTTSSYKFGTATTNLGVQTFMGAWRSNAAINRITVIPASGNLIAGTRCTIYGLGA